MQSNGEGPESAEEALQNYWRERIDEFERIIYPVFHEKGYSKNTAFMITMLDEVDDAIMAAIAAREKLQ